MKAMMKCSFQRAKVKTGLVRRGLSFTIVGGLVFMKVSKVSFSDIF